MVRGRFGGNSKPIGGSLGNYKHKLGFIHIPKCAGCSVGMYLQQLGNWHLVETRSQKYAAEPFKNYPSYELFTVIRHPISWIQSGFKMWKQRRNYKLSFDEHVDKIIYNSQSKSIYENFDWDWHCSILPDEHIGNMKPKIFKMEELDKLKTYLIEYFPEADNYSFKIENNTNPEIIEMSPVTMEKVKKFSKQYAEKFEYEL